MNFEQMLLEDFNKSTEKKFVLTKDMEEQIINEALASLSEGIGQHLLGAASYVGAKAAWAIGKTVNGTKVVSKGLFGKNRQHPDYRPHNDPNHRDYNPNHRDANGNIDFDPTANDRIPSLFNSMLSKASNANGNGQNGNGRFSYNTNMMQQLNQQNSMN